MKFRVKLNEDEKEIDVTRQGDRLIIRYDQQEFSAHLLHVVDAHFVLEVEESGPDGFVRRKRIRAAGFRDGDRRQLWANGRLVNYERLREGAAAQEVDESASLSASIPAVVSEVLVSPGDSITTGAQLILLESMKMILPILAPYDGIVTAVKCQAGDAVQPGFQLIEIEPQA